MEITRFIEKHTVLSICLIAIASFSSGFGAYKAILEVSNTEPVPKETYKKLQKDSVLLLEERKRTDTLDEKLRDLQEKIKDLELDASKFDSDLIQDPLDYSHWDYKIDNGPGSWLGLVFLPKGKLIVYGPGGTGPRNQHMNSWKRKDSQIILKMNDGFATYEGKLISDSMLVGNGSNQKGGNWKWSATKISI